MNSMKQAMLQQTDALLFFAAKNQQELLLQVKKLLKHKLLSEGIVKAHNCAVATKAMCRLFISAGDFSSLQLALEQAKARLERGVRRDGRIGKGIFYAENADAGNGKIAFVFPGQGSQFPGMGSDLAKRYPVVQQWIQRLDNALTDILGEAPSRFFFEGKYTKEAHPRLFDLEVGACIVGTLSLSYYDLLTDLGIKPDMILGHSTGEITALVASNSMKDAMQDDVFKKILRCFTQTYHQVSKSSPEPEGTLYSVGGMSSERIQSCFQSPVQDVYIALDNCPNQKIVYSPDQYAKTILERLQNAGAIVDVMPFRYAYHTPLFTSVSQAMMAFYDQFEFVQGEPSLFSCVTAKPFPIAASQAKQQACDLLHQQVKFQATVENLYEDEGITTFVEVGPRNNISSFMQDSLRSKQAQVISSGHASLNEVEAFLQMIGQLFIAGRLHDVSVLYLASSNQTQQNEQQSDHNSDPSNQPLLDSKFHAQALQEHFDLMQTFLQQQQRVMGLLLGQAQTTASPEHVEERAEQNFIMLGETVENNSQKGVWRRTVTLESEPYLLDHAFGGEPSIRQSGHSALPVIPFTFSMETVAEAASALVGDGWFIQKLYDIRALNWFIFVGQPLQLEIQAQRLDDTHLLCRIFNTSGEKRRLSFECKVEVARDKLALVTSEMFKPAGQITSPYHQDNFYIGQHPPSPWVPGEFHGVAFQAVRSIKAMGEDGLVGELITLPRNDLFKQIDNPNFIIDPIIIDASMHLTAYWIHSKHAADLTILPFYIESYEFFSEPLPENTTITVAVRASIVQVDGKAMPDDAAYQFFDHQDNLLAQNDFHTCSTQVMPENTAYRKFYPESLAVKSDVEFFDEQGNLLARVKSRLDRHFSVPVRYEQFTSYPAYYYISETDEHSSCMVPYAADFLSSSGQVWLYKLAYLVFTRQEWSYWQGLNEAEGLDYLYNMIVCKDAAREYLFSTTQKRYAPIDLTCEQVGKDWHCSRLGETTAPLLVQVERNDDRYMARLIRD